MTVIPPLAHTYEHPDVAHIRRKIIIPTTTGDFPVTSIAGTVLAMVMEETTGSAGARFQLFDGTDDGGDYMGPWTLSSGQSFDSAYPPFGLPFRSGLFLAVSAGSGARGLYLLHPLPR